MVNYVQASREFDRIATSRMRIHKGGLSLSSALGNRSSIRIRWKLRRLGLLDTEEGKDLIQLIDELGFNETLATQPIGVRYASVERKEDSATIFSPMMNSILIQKNDE